ncbi:MAG: DNA/RNA nuclease SfsA [Desulfofustis sp.]|nr:DNA/RNA nuclease SfsA [Desulfofustis sp.]
MDFDAPLKQGTLIRRYKRFLADIELPEGEEITVHCPNSGSMRGCSTPGSPVCFSRSDNPGRKYPHTLEMVHSGNSWIGVNTSRTNQIVAEAIEKGQIKEFPSFDAMRREIKTSAGSRLDLLLEKNGAQAYIEIKNCSLVENGVALFPDAVTKRGTKHLKELERLVGSGCKGVIFFLVQRLDCDCFSPAAAIDPEYATTLAEVRHKGVEILAYQARVTPKSIDVTNSLPVKFDG